MRTRQGPQVCYAYVLALAWQDNPLYKAGFTKGEEVGSNCAHVEVVHVSELAS